MQIVRQPYQAGSALIAALLLIAIIAGFATLMLVRSWQLNRIHIQTKVQKQAEFMRISQAGIIWAKAQIQHDWEQGMMKKKLPHFPQKITIDQRHGTFANFEIKASIVPLENRFNLNSIKQGDGKVRLQRILDFALPNLSKQQLNTLLQALIAWFTPNASINNIYLKHKPPYLASNQSMLSLSELYLIRGFTSAIVRHLMPFVSILPSSVNKLDVNYSTSEMLSVWFGIALSQATALHQCILATGGVRSHAALKQCWIRTGLHHTSVLQEDIEPLSHYFGVTVKVGHKQQQFITHAIIRVMLLSKPAYGSPVTVSVYSETNRFF